MENDNISEAVSETVAEETCRIGEGLREARQCYDEVRRKATERLRDAREITLGDVLNRVLVSVKRHPRSSLAAAAAVGFFLGRLFRR